MAANLKNRGGFLIISGKKFVDQIWSSTPPSPCTTIFWRRAHVAGSVYDKNVDDKIRPSVVPDDVIEAPSDKYWGPNPQTGVFGPEGGNGDIKLPSGGGESAESVLGQKAWFRPLEDIEKPQAN